MPPKPSKPPKYWQYFDTILEDQTLDGLPPELETCGDCLARHERCHLLVAGKKGRKRGIAAVCIVQCDSCGSVHLTQIFTDTHKGRPMHSSVLEEIARDMGITKRPRVSVPERPNEG